MKEMDELLDFLSKRDDYSIFAGFAAQLLLGIKASPDIDILVRSKDKAEEFKKELGWAEIESRFMRLSKAGFELDVVWTANQAILDSAIEMDYEGRKLKVITPEALFITKLNNQLASPNRTEEKKARDSEVINELRKKIDVEKLNDLIPQLKPEFWTKREW